MIDKRHAADERDGRLNLEHQRERHRLADIRLCLPHHADMPC